MCVRVAEHACFSLLAAGWGLVTPIKKEAESSGEGTPGAAAQAAAMPLDRSIKQEPPSTPPASDRYGLF